MLLSMFMQLQKEGDMEFVRIVIVRTGIYSDSFFLSQLTVNQGRRSTLLEGEPSKVPQMVNV